MQNSLVRSFIAAELPDNIKIKIDELQRNFKKSGLDYIKWVNPSSIHLTLKFLGNVDARDLKRITGALAEGCKGCKNIDIELSGLGVFPNYNRPRVMWIGLQGQLSTLLNLQRQIDDKLEPLGFTKEKRPFSPHITLGRVRDKASVTELKGCAQVIQSMQYSERYNLVIDSVKLMKSQLMPTGAIYTEIATVKLG